MSIRPDILERGEPARLFPILSERNKEARALSPFLATLAVVRNYAGSIFGSIGIKIGPRSKIHCYTEVTFPRDRHKQSLGRPDGLIVIDTGRSQWMALVEAKVGNNELTGEQLERYLEIARENGIDAVITISNQFSAIPHHHPVSISSRKTRSVDLFHFSWMHLLTEAELLLMNADVEDDEQAFLLNEFKRFIAHESTGVSGFEQMPPEWKRLVQKAKSDGTIGGDDARAVAEAWQQECRDLTLILSRQLGDKVEQQLNRRQVANPLVRFDDDLTELTENHTLSVSLSIPDTAANLDITANLASGVIILSTWLRAPADKKRNSARLNWLLRQLPAEADEDVRIRGYWPGRSAPTEASLAKLRNDQTWLFDGKDGMQIVSFEVFQCVDLGARFAQPRTFIKELEQSVPKFYKNVVENLSEWQPSPPKLSEKRASPDTVAPEKLVGGEED